MDRFRDREEAGRKLGEKLANLARRRDVIVLALPRGGVPVGLEVAKALGASLDIFVVRKLGVPGHEELAMGAIASGGVTVVNDDVVRQLDIDEETIRRVARAEANEIERRERLYRGDRPAPKIEGKIAILVDDGLATGATMRAAVAALRQMKPAKVIVAVPVGSPSTVNELAEQVDQIAVLVTPEPFWAVGLWYQEFEQLTDDEVRELLSKAQAKAPPATQPNPQPKTQAKQADPIWIEDIRSDDRRLAEAIAEGANALTGSDDDLDPILDCIGDARIVLLGEATHGTHEMYSLRAEITKRLIDEKGFSAVCVEADWPDAYRVDRYVRGAGDDESADRALSGFERFPTWMWRNTAVLSFVGWLRDRNDHADRKAGFYGIDLYSLHRSIEVVIGTLDRLDPAAARRARERYRCFEEAGGDPERYAMMSMSKSCEEEVIRQLLDVQRLASRFGADEDFFSVAMNAHLVANAERYYRSMFGGRVSSWNLRDTHMVETLAGILDNLARRGEPPRVVVWAHNSHLGDARATEMGRWGELNVGQLCRQKWGDEVRSIGFTTYTGTVSAASDWGGPVERKRVRPALAGSYEAIFHDAGVERFFLDLGRLGEVAGALAQPRLERAIGVIYRPETERMSHWFSANLPNQFDGVIHLDVTGAVEPLERGKVWTIEEEPPETYPTGL